jgi:Rho-binding antiterminator
MSEKRPYRQIACSIHDRLESLATLGRTTHIVFRDADGSLHETVDRLVDVFAREGEEFLKTAAGEVIRLDRLERVDGVPVPSAEGG